MKRVWALALVLALVVLPMEPANAASTTLKLGSSGQSVTTLQLALKAYGYFNHPRITGNFGSVTKKSLKRWERANGYKANGKITIGSKEWRKMVGSTKADGKPPKFCLAYGAGSAKVQCASKTDGRTYAIQHGKVADWATVRFGGLASDKSGPWFTREGIFYIGKKQPTGFSNLYFVDMPYWMPFSGGQGFHYSSEFFQGYPYSHGCIGIKYRSMAQWMYDWTPEGTLVIVTAA